MPLLVTKRVLPRPTVRKAQGRGPDGPSGGKYAPNTIIGVVGSAAAAAPAVGAAKVSAKKDNGSPGLAQSGAALILLSSVTWG